MKSLITLLLIMLSIQITFAKTERKESTSNFNMYPRITDGKRQAISLRVEKSSGKTNATFNDGSPVSNKMVPNYLIGIQYFFDKLIFGAEASVSPISILVNMQYDIIKSDTYKLGFGGGLGNVDYKTNQILIPYSIHIIASIKAISNSYYEATPFIAVQYLNSFERLMYRPSKGTTGGPVFNTVDRVEKISYNLGLANDFKFNAKTFSLDLYGGIQKELHRSNVTSFPGTTSYSDLENVIGIKFSYGF